jgi:hypothetical protein
VELMFSEIASDRGEDCYTDPGGRVIKFLVNSCVKTVFSLYFIDIHNGMGPNNFNLTKERDRKREITL